MFVCDIPTSELRMIDSGSGRSVSEAVVDCMGDLASKRYEFRIKDEYVQHYRDLDVDRFQGPWLTLDNEEVEFDLAKGLLYFRKTGRTGQVKWKGPNIVEMEQDVFQKLCEVNEDDQLQFRTGEIWIRYDSNYLSMPTRMRQVSKSMELYDCNIKKRPIGLTYKIADTGEQVLVAKVQPGSESEDAAIQ